ncbi:MAG: hypothetical protein Q8O91_00275 [Candidatus Aminicenantes bacterium]|nr:hypothetical protein [Candidatus Aminicenantes bacterium]
MKPPGLELEMVQTYLPYMIALVCAAAISAFLFFRMSRDEPSARHSPVAYIYGRVRRKWTPGQSPGPRPPWHLRHTPDPKLGT